MKIALAILVGFAIIATLGAFMDFNVVTNLLNIFGFLQSIFDVIVALVLQIYNVIVEHTIVFSIFGIFIFVWVVKVLLETFVGGDD